MKVCDRCSLLWGVGKAMQQTLARDGITLIGQIARLPEAELVARYGKIGHRLSLCSRGEDDRSVDPDGEADDQGSLGDRSEQDDVHKEVAP